MGRQQPATERAIDFLRRIARERDPGTLLGTLVDLARQAGVGRSTMVAASRQLRDEGLVEVIPHRGVLAAHPGAGERLRNPPVDTYQPRLRWQRIAEQIRSQARGGALLHESRPTRVTAIAAACGADYRTVRKALNALVAEGTLLETGSGFVTVMARPERRRNTVVLIARGGIDQDELFVMSDRSRETYRELQVECAERGLSLRPVLFHYAGTNRLVCADTNRDFEITREDLDHTVGFVVWTPGLRDLGLTSFVRTLSSQGLPVAILDETGRGPRRPPRMATCYRVGFGEKPGLDMGRYLAALGHRKVAYVVLNGSTLARDARLDGLRRGLAERTSSTQVDTFALLSETSPMPVDRGDVITPFLHDALSTRRSPENELMAEAMRRLYATLKLEYTRGANAREGEQVFRALTSRTDLTAWVCANDDIALPALRYARQHRIDVPGRLSIVGFDDIPQAAMAGLTTYSFGIRRTVRAIVHGLLAPHHRPGTEERMPPGRVVERETAGRRSQ